MIIEQILYSLKYLHELNIIHRDIKSPNVLLSKSLDNIREESCAKIVDFGFATFLDPNSDGLDLFCGSDDHMAPEIIIGSNNPENIGHLRVPGTKYKSGVDIWAVGCITYELFTGTTPFYDDNFEAMHKKIVLDRPIFKTFKHLKKNVMAIDFIMRCLEKDPLKRSTACELLDHPWIKLQTN